MISMNKGRKYRHSLIATAVVMMAVAIAIEAKRKSDTQPLTVVPSVDLQRYAGQWYEIGRLPNRFQRNCVSDTSATYTLLSEGKIKVLNRCLESNGKVNQAEGVARLASTSGPTSKLEVRFAPSYLSFLPFVWGDYQIIALGENYEYSLVGEPGRKYLWILSRTPQMDEATYQALLKQAQSQGFDTSKMMKTKQSAANK